ncbi:MAG: glycosyltransferase 87 family protein [Candidatus Paceibacterota bacterium]
MAIISFFKKFLFIFLIGFSIFIFLNYISFLFAPVTCWKLGYTLCADQGEDFYSLYQAAFNFSKNLFIYQKPPPPFLVVPYYMPFKYFPLSPVIIGYPFLKISSSVFDSYRFFLLLNILFYIFSFLGIFLLASFFRKSLFEKIILFTFWFSFFPIVSDLRMGQFNLISALCFLLAFIFIVFDKKILASFSWFFSLLFKPLTFFNFFYFLKNRNKIAIFLFGLNLAFTLIYFLYYYFLDPSSFQNIFKIYNLFSSQRVGWQIHYPDNFSVHSFLGEIFYDKFPLIFKIFSLTFKIVLILIFLFLTFKLKFNRNNQKIEYYYLLYSFLTPVIVYPEVWESWLAIYSVILALLFILLETYKEKIFIFINYLLLATPSFYYFYQKTKSPFWRFLLIGEKAVPQLLIYMYLTYLLFKFLHTQNYKKMIK